MLFLYNIYLSIDRSIVYTMYISLYLYYSINSFLVLFHCSLVPDLLVSPRSIYDDQPNAHKRFMEKLDARIRNHDREIEKMCNFHHQGFVDAITELLKVRADAEKLMVREMFSCTPEHACFSICDN